MIGEWCQDHWFLMVCVVAQDWSEVTRVFSECSEIPRLQHYRVSQKKLHLVLEGCSTPKFKEIKVGGVLESSGSQLSNAYNSISVAFKTRDI